METFAQKFDRYVASDVSAKVLIDKCLGLGLNRQAVIGMLGEATDPDARRKIAWMSRKFRSEVLSTKSRAALSKRLRTAAREIQALFSHPIIRLHPASERFLALAPTLRREAQNVDRFPAPKIGRLFSDRAFGQHLLRVGICIALDVPRTLSFDEVEHLLWFSAEARGLPQKPYGGSRSLEREYKRFTNSTQGKLWVTLLAQESLAAKPS